VTAGKLERVAPDAFATMREAIGRRDTADVRAVYRSGAFPRADRVVDLDRRYRWDLLHACYGAGDVCDLYDAGLTDAHIDTALRAIVPPLDPPPPTPMTKEVAP
jgi:hypothetical protein